MIAASQPIAAQRSRVDVRIRPAAKTAPVSSRVSGSPMAAVEGRGGGVAATSGALGSGKLEELPCGRLRVEPHGVRRVGTDERAPVDARRPPRDVVALEISRRGDAYLAVPGDRCSAASGAAPARAGDGGKAFAGRRGWFCCGMRSIRSA